MPLKLFIELIQGTLFHFYDKRNRKLIKMNKDHYVAPEGVHKINPHVAVVQDPYNFRDLAEKEKGNGRSTDNREDPRDY